MKFWLMKSEPDVYGIKHLKKDKVEMWEGCRNYQVRNFFRDDMKVGDLAIFSHSMCKPAGPAGVMRIVKEAYTDPVQFDKKSKYYDAKSDPKNPRWLCPDVEFVAEFERTLPLAELRETPGLEDMWALRKGNRISVVPMTRDEFRIVLKLAGMKLKDVT